MSDVTVVKLPPFHETVVAALEPLRLVGVSASEGKYGEVMALLALINETEIPAKALPAVAKACRGVNEMFTSATVGSVKTLAEFANTVALNLDARLEARQRVPAFLNYGSFGAGVKILQEWLVEHGFGEGIDIDEDYGNMTRARVMDLQKKHDLEVDGHVGPATRKMLLDEHGWDFEAACRATRGKTFFVQPDGSRIQWEPVIQ